MPNRSGGDPALEKLGRRLQQQTQTAREKEAIERRSSAGMIGQLSRGTSLKGYRRGGKVKKTGPALLHKGEKVIPAKKARKKR